MKTDTQAATEAKGDQEGSCGGVDAPPKGVSGLQVMLGAMELQGKEGGNPGVLSWP